jgi:hypothetical protein
MAVTILQQFRNNPLQTGGSEAKPLAPGVPFLPRAKIARRDRAAKLLAELGDPVREPRDFAAGGVTVDDVFLRSADYGRLGLNHGRERRGAIARCDRLLDLAYRATQARASRFIDDGAARDLAGGFLGRLGIGHVGRGESY